MQNSEKNTDFAAIAAEIAQRVALACEANRPLFLIVHYEHEAIKAAFIGRLQRMLGSMEIGTQAYNPGERPEHAAGRLYPLLTASAGTKSVALIEDLPQPPEGIGLDPFFLDYLNLHRDLISKQCLRLVLFLHTADTADFIAGAGDFWDFRQHTFWLEGRPESERTSLWEIQDWAPRMTDLTEDEKRTVAKHLEDVHSLIEVTADPTEKASLLLDLSRWLFRRNLFSLAANAAFSGLDLLGDTSTSLRASMEFAVGYALRKSNHLADALAHYRKALAIRREIGDRAGEGKALNNIALIYIAWGRYEEALKTLQESLAISKEIGDRAGEGTVLNNIAQIYDAWGRYDEALKTLQESLAISKEIGDRAGEGTVLNNISQIYRAWGRYEEALKTLQESLAIKREIGDRAGEGAVLNNISQIYSVWGRYEEALKTLQEGLAIRREIGDRAGEGITLNNISQIYDVWGRYDEALKALQESLAIRREIGDRAGEGVTCWNLAVEYKRRGEMRKAHEYALRAVTIEEETSHPDLEKSREFLRKLEESLKTETNPGAI